MMRPVVSAVLLLLTVTLLGAQSGKDESKLKPDAKALEQRFTMVKQRYDEAKRRYIWVLEAKETSEKPAHFDAVFQDADDKEVTSVRIEFEDGGKRTTKGQRYNAFVKYPTRKTMEKVTEIVVKKSD
jgi:hypothetical protein